MTANPRSMREDRLSGAMSYSTHVVLLVVPVHEAGEPLLDHGLRLEAKIATRRLDVGKAFRYIAGLQRQQLLPGSATQCPLEDRDEVEELLGAVVAEVIDPVGNSLRH